MSFLVCVISLGWGLCAFLCECGVTRYALCGQLRGVSCVELCGICLNVAWGDLYGDEGCQVGFQGLMVP